MRAKPGIWTFGVFLLAHLGQPAAANADGLVFWDQSVAAAVNNAITTGDACRTSPYARYRQTCVGNSLNITLERDPFETLTFLDHIALFVDKYKDLDASRQIMPGIKFKMGVNLSNVYEQEAVVHARLRVRW